MDMKNFLFAILLFVLVSCGGSSYEVNRGNNHHDDEAVEVESNSSVKHSEGKKPGVKKIQYDLIGHKLSEGLSEGYRKEGWYWEIAEGQISDFQIAEVLSDSDNDYEFVATMVLSSANNKCDAKAQISYVLENGKWQLLKVKSLGVMPISDKKFEDCLTYEIGDDGWGGVDCLKVTNESETVLAVGGRILSEYNGWKNFSVLVEPFETKQVGGFMSMGGGSVTDYEVHFVVRP